MTVRPTNRLTDRLTDRPTEGDILGNNSRTSWSYTPLVVLVTCGKRSLTPSLVMVGVVVLVLVLVVVGRSGGSEDASVQ